MKEIKNKSLLNRMRNPKYVIRDSKRDMEEYEGKHKPLRKPSPALRLTAATKLTLSVAPPDALIAASGNLLTPCPREGKGNMIRVREGIDSLGFLVCCFFYKIYIYLYVKFM